MTIHMAILTGWLCWISRTLLRDQLLSLSQSKLYTSAHTLEVMFLSARVVFLFSPLLPYTYQVKHSQRLWQYLQVVVESRG
jgi:hypothetical protein